MMNVKEYRHKILISSGAPWEALVGYSRAVRVGDNVFISGTTGTNEKGEVVSRDNPYAQTIQAIRNIEKALKQAGASLNDVVQTRIYVKNISHWKEIGRAHEELFRDIRPATVMVEVKSLVDSDMLVEIEAIASVR